MGVEYPSDLNVHKNSFSNIPQYDGSDSIVNTSDIDDTLNSEVDIDDKSVNNSDNDDTLVSEFDTDDEIDLELPRVVLEPHQDGVDAVQLTDLSDNLNLPLFLVLNARSVRKKIHNLKTTINTIKPDITLISETWETNTMDIPKILDSPNLKSLSFVRNRDHPSHLSQTGGGTCIIFNESRFDVVSAGIKPPEGGSSLGNCLSQI